MEVRELCAESGHSRPATLTIRSQLSKRRGGDNSHTRRPSWTSIRCFVVRPSRGRAGTAVSVPAGAAERQSSVRMPRISPVPAGCSGAGQSRSDALAWFEQAANVTGRAAATRCFVAPDCRVPGPGAGWRPVLSAVASGNRAPRVPRAGIEAHPRTTAGRSSPTHGCSGRFTPRRPAEPRVSRPGGSDLMRLVTPRSLRVRRSPRDAGATGSSRCGGGQVVRTVRRGG